MDHGGHHVSRWLGAIPIRSAWRRHERTGATSARRPEIEAGRRGASDGLAQIASLCNVNALNATFKGAGLRGRGPWHVTCHGPGAHALRRVGIFAAISDSAASDAASMISDSAEAGR